MAAAAGHVRAAGRRADVRRAGRRPLLPDEGAAAGGRQRRRADVHHHLRGPHHRDRQDRDGQPDGRPALRGLGRRPARRARGGEQELLQRARYLPAGYRPGAVGERPRWGDLPGRIDDHSAVRQERLSDAGAHLLPQDEGDRPRGQARPEVLQGRDPGVLPQHDLLRSWSVRHRGRVQDVLRQTGQEPDRGGGCGHRRADPLPERA